MKPIQPPNYTQIPNTILDAMGEMSGAEFKVVMAIARQTFGWHKERDKISISQLMALTGLSRQGVVNATAGAIEQGFVGSEVDEADALGGVWYWLIVADEGSQNSRPVKKVDQSKKLTKTSQLFRPELVKKVDSQKKGNKEKKPPPPNPQTEQATVGGGGGELTETERFLIAEGFQPKTAREFRLLDLEACRQSIKKFRSEGTQIGGMVLSWRANPPQRAPARASPPPIAARPADRNDRITTARKLRELAEKQRHEQQTTAI